MNTLVSVIIPTYNRAQCISNAIDSVLYQTYKHYEIIVVDDGSTDDTLKVLEKYSDIVRTFKQNNSGVAAARNLGIKMARGEWIAFLDSDDRWLPDKLNKQIYWLKEHKSQVCFCTALIDYGNERKSESLLYKKCDVECVYFEDSIELPVLYDVPLWLPSAVIKKNLLYDIGLFDENLIVSEDTKLIYDICLNKGVSYLHNDFLIIDRTNEVDGLTNNRSVEFLLKKYKDYYQVEKYLYEKINNNKRIKNKTKTNMAHYSSMVARYSCVIGNYGDARRFAIRSLTENINMKILKRSVPIAVFPHLVKSYLSK
jgi:glycosyltransferase involved in cell wall biosynthesis